MGDVGAELIEVASLRGLQRVGNGVKFRILWRVRPDFARRILLIGVTRPETGAIALRREATEIDAGLGARSAAKEPNGSGLQTDAEDAADSFKVLIDAIVPVLFESSLAVPVSGFIPARFTQLIEVIDRGFDDV